MSIAVYQGIETWVIYMMKIRIKARIIAAAATPPNMV
jgi:hypothetical protein